MPREERQKIYEIMTMPQQELLKAAKAQLTSDKNKEMLSEMIRTVPNSVSSPNNFYLPLKSLP